MPKTQENEQRTQSNNTHYKSQDSGPGNVAQPRLPPIVHNRASTDKNGYPDTHMLQKIKRNVEAEVCGMVGAARRPGFHRLSRSHRVSSREQSRARFCHCHDAGLFATRAEVLN